MESQAKRGARDSARSEAIKYVTFSGATDVKRAAKRTTGRLVLTNIRSQTSPAQELGPMASFVLARAEATSRGEAPRARLVAAT